MSLNTLRWAASGVLALCICLLAGPLVSSADDTDKKEREKNIKNDKAAADDVIKLADGGGVAKDLAKKHEIGHVMHGFKLRTKDGMPPINGRAGIGVGDKPGAIEPDGIEAKIINLSKKKPMSKAELTKEADALVKAAKITRAIAEINEFYTPEKKMGDKDPKDYRKYNQDMIKGSDDLIDAIKKGDPMQVKKVASKLNQSCNDCHGKFRDNND
jgi:soluble cytochrome b562